MEFCDYGCKQQAKYQFKNGKWCCSEILTKCPEVRRKNSSRNRRPDRYNPSKVKVACDFCKSETSLNNIKHHMQTCYLNPQNIKLCPVCNKIIKDYKHNDTCSCKCAGEYFKEMYSEVRRNNGKMLTYRTICFTNHEKKCIICGEDKIVTVHHYDEDHKNDLPENLIPLCPTHQGYMHSKFRDLINEKVNQYRQEWIIKTQE